MLESGDEASVRSAILDGQGHRTKGRRGGISRFVLPLPEFSWEKQGWRFIRNVLDGFWWFGLFPLIKVKRMAKQLPFSELDLLAFVENRCRDVGAVYQRNEYFNQRYRLIGVARAFSTLSACEGHCEQPYVRIWEEGVWLPPPDVHPRDWNANDYGREKMGSVLRVLDWGDHFVELKWLKEPMDRRKIQMLQHRFLERISTGLDELLRCLPDKVVVKDPEKSVGNRWVQGFEPDDRWMIDEGQPLVSGIKKVTSMGPVEVEFTYDVSHLKEVAEKHIQSLKFRHLGNMGRMIVHELNNPISGIYNLAQLMQMSLDDGQVEVKQMLKTIELQCRRAKDVIDHLSVYFESNPVQRTSEKERLSVWDVFSDVVTLTQSVLKGARLERHVTPKNLQIVSHRLKLLHMLVNLVINASEALARQGRDDGRIVLEAKPVERGVGIWVVDNGPGLPPEIKGNMFKPFFSTKTPGNPNCGLGLSLVKFFSNEMGYGLQVSSELGKGTTFKIFVQ